MAITYTYSFNCTTRYRLSSETVDILTPTFDDSIVLYSCTAETTKLEDIKVPLPDYLQGIDDNLQWYLSNDYKDSVVSGQELTASQWTLTNEVKLGTFTSYDATITLYTNSGPKTLKWVYKQEDTTETFVQTTTWQPIPAISSSSYNTEYASFISLHAPKIPVWVSSKNGSDSTLYVFTNWENPVKTVNAEEYTIKASYSGTTYDEANPYTLSSANPFADAEPYHYGTGTPPDGYFIPIGEDDNPTTMNDVKVQAAEVNGYSNLKTLDQFKINSHGISYIEKGTFPLLNEVTSVEIAKTDPYKLTITYNTNTTKITAITLGNTNCYNAANKNGPLYEKLKHGNEEFPKRLGFILVGGGGGAGGGGRYDPDKNKKNSHGDFIIPGGGGGGGEIVYGVLDISYEAAKKLQDEEKPDSLVYYITIGNGGDFGSHNISSGAASGGHDGYSGKKGADSVLYVYTKAGKKKDILKACGGSGGGGATKFTLGTGGDGGSYSNSRNIANIADTYNCVVKGAIKGGRGGHPTSQTSVENESLSFSIYFSNAVPPVNPKYMLSKSHPASSKTYSTDENTDSKVFKTPGGHSFGSGATSTSSAVTGGGGACCASSYRAGAGGYFGIYY